jgi:hypothetical protein
MALNLALSQPLKHFLNKICAVHKNTYYFLKAILILCSHQCQDAAFAN